jgi:hypothetical protein
LSDSGESKGHHAPSMGGVLRAYVRPVLRFAVAFVVFIFGLYLLQFSFSLHPAAAQQGVERVTLDSLPAEVSSTNIHLSGRFEPQQYVEVRVNHQMATTLATSRDGSFETDVAIGKRHNQITVRPISPDGKPDRNAEARLTTVFKSNPPQPPQVSAVMESSAETRILMGTADPNAIFEIEDDAGKTVAYPTGDRTGTFAFMVPTATVERPEQYSVLFGPDLEQRVSLKSILTQAVKSSISRSVTIEFGSEAANIEMRAKAPLAVPQVRGLILGELNDEEFIHEIFGKVFPYPEDLLYGEMDRPQRSVTVNENGEADVTVTMHLPFVPGRRGALLVETSNWRSDPLSHLGIRPSGEGLGNWPLQTSQDNFTVCFEDFHFDWMRPLPARLDTGEAEWKGPLKEAEIEVVAEPALPVEKQDRGDRQPAERTLTVREVLNDLRFPTLASTVAITLNRSIPFVWLLLLLRANKSLMAHEATSGWRGRSRIATTCLILMVLSVWVVFYRVSFGLRSALSFISGSQETWHDVNSLTVFIALYLSFLIVLRPFTAALEEKADKWLAWSGLGDLPVSLPWRRRCYWTAGALLAVAIASLWQGPHLLKTLSARGLAEDQTQFLANFLQNWNGALWIFVLSLALGWLSRWRIGAIFGVLCTLAIFMVSVAVLLSPRPEALKGIGPSAAAAIVQKLGHVNVALLLYTSTLLACLVLSYSLIPKGLSRNYARLLFILGIGLLIPIFSFLPARWTNEMSAFLLVAIALWVLYYVARISPGFQNWLAHRTNTRILWLSAAAMVIVLLVPEGSHPGKVFAGQGFFSLLNEFIYFWAYVPLAGVLIWLHLRHRQRQSVPRTEELQLAYFIFSVYLVGYSAWWLYLPLPLIIGYGIARAWLIQDFPAPVSNDTPPSLKDTLAELIKKRSRDKLARSVRKGQEKKLEKGEITIDDYQKAVEDKSESFALDDRSNRNALQEIALANGPTGHAWSNAILAVRYAVPLALVPIALAIYEFAASEERDFPALTFVLRMVLSFAYWLTLAFFFGYFYRFIKGKSGLAKGIFLAAGVIFPYLCMRLIETLSLTEFRYFFFWAMQVLAFCTILGLFSFDYETLRRNGFSFADLLALHNTPILSAFASGMLAALVPSIIAVAKGEVLDLVKFLADRILPQAPK